MSTAAPADVPQHTPISEDALERSMRLNVIAGFLGMFWIVVPLGLPLPLLLRAVEASGVQLGIMSAAWQLAMLAQVPSAFIVERLRQRKPFWASVSIIHRLLWFVPALLPALLPDRKELWPTLIIVALALSNILGQGGTGPWQSWMADLLPPARAGQFWGIRHRWISAAMVIAALIYGIMLDRLTQPPLEFFGFQLVFAMAALFGTADIVLHCWVTEPKPVHHTSGGNFWQRTVAPLRDANFRRLTIAMGLWTAGQAMLGYTMGLPGFFSMVYVRETFGATYAQASWLFIGAGIGAVLWTPTIGHWIDKWGGRRVMLLLTGVGPVLMLAWLFVTNGKWSLPWLSTTPVPQPIVVLTLVSLVMGGFYSASWVCQVRLTQALTSPVGRTIAMGVHWSLVGLIGSLGALFAGWVKDHLPTEWLGAVFPGSAPWSYFQLLVVLHVCIAWFIVRPMVKRITL